MPEQSKADLIAERQANLPLPDEPPVESDWNSQSDSINVKGGERQDELPAGDATDLNKPATAASGVREEGGADLSGVGREGKDNLDGLPKDALKK